LINLYNNQKLQLKGTFLDKLKYFLEEVLREEKWSGKPINIVIVDNPYISELNEKFLKRSGPTDVLAFPLEESPEVYISAEMAMERAGERRFAVELVRYVLHGVLHLLGYHHENPRAEKILREKEEYYLKKWEGKL